MSDPTPEFPPIADLIPHSGTMCLLDRVVAWDSGQTQCALTVSENDPFADSSGRIPAYVGIEYLSQCAAAHACLKASNEEGDSTPKVALLLGSRKVELFADHFAVGQSLLIQAARVAATEDTAIFAGEIRDAGSNDALLKAQLTYFQPEILDESRA